MALKPRTHPRKAPRQARAQATVDALLEATARVLREDGYERTSTSRVARVAGVSIGSLYQYFPSKEALVAALIDKHVSALEAVLHQQLARLLEEDPPLPMAARQMVGTLLAVYRHDPALHRLLLEQVPQLGQQARWQSVEQQMTFALTAALEAHADVIFPSNFALAAFILVQSLAATTRHSVLYQPELIEDAQLVDELTHLIVRYLGGEDAHPEAAQARRDKAASLRGPQET